MPLSPVVRRVCILLVVLTMVHCAAVPGAKAQYAQQIPGDNTGYYKDTDYIMYRVMGAAVVGIIVAILSCVCGCCFCFIQVCAKCGCKCVKERCSCCGAGEPAPEGYTQKQRLVLVVVLFIAWAFIICGSGLGYAGNADVATGLGDLADSSSTTASSLVAQIIMAYDSAVSVSTATIDAAMKTDALKLEKDVKDGAKTLKETDNLRVLAVYIFYAIMMVVPVLGLFSWICGVATFAYIMTQICFCMLFVAWLFFGLTFATGTILDDTCVEAGKHVHGEPNVLKSLLACDASAASLSTYQDVWTTLDQAQTALDGVAAGTSVSETTYGFTTNTYSVAAAAVNSKKYYRARDMLVGMYTAYGVDSSTCPTMNNKKDVKLCFVPGVTQSTYTSICGSGGSNVNAAKCHKQSQILSAAGMTGSSYLIGCEHLNLIALDLNNKICGPMVGGLINVCVGQAFLGFFYFFVLAVGCMGINRFNNENYHGLKIAPSDTYGTTPGMQMAPVGGNGYQPADGGGGYSAEQAMAATKIQSLQRQKVAKKKVKAKRG